MLLESKWTVVLAAFISLAGVETISAQAPAGAEKSSNADKSGGAFSLSPTALPAGKVAARAVAQEERELPRGQGQVMMKYTITPYTSAVKSTEKPEQAVIDWILRDTGTEVWFSEPLGFLSASKDTLRVYHTREMQRKISAIVDQLVASKAEPYAVGVRLLTVGSPNWRSTALPMLRPVAVQSQGVEGWLLSRENAAVLAARLRKRTDCREHSSPSLVIENGQPHTLSAITPRNYVRSIRARDFGFPNYELVTAQINEGYSLQISPLVSLDERSMDVVVKCNVDQVEKLVPVSIDVPGLATQQQQRVQIQVPQIVSWRLHERFRWPTDQVLLLSCGVVATPAAGRGGTLDILNPLIGDKGRADALLFIEFKGKASNTLLNVENTSRSGNVNSRGRY